MSSLFDVSTEKWRLRGTSDSASREAAQHQVISRDKGPKRQALVPSKKIKCLPLCFLQTARLKFEQSSKKTVGDLAVSLNPTNTTLNGGSLGSWVDEDRSKLRVEM